ncbi:MAG: ComEC/Rec2 family competence protein [Verrucomicrobiota bacterium]
MRDEASIASETDFVPASAPAGYGSLKTRIWPRQPFIGLALAAMAGIAAADFAPNHSAVPIVLVAIPALAALLLRNSLAIYIFVALGFFFLHSLRVSDSPALQLARELGDDPHPITVRGIVVSEPKISASGSASFLLEAESIALDGATRPCHARFFARWRHEVEFGDEIQLFGTAEQVAAPRNPGEFDMRGYLARHDVHRELIVRYPENGALFRRTGGNRILRAAQKSRAWMQATLSRGLDDSPEVTGLISGMVLGLRHQTPEDIEEPFQQTGTLHLFAVAGLHVGIVARLLWILATVARLPRRWATVLIIPALFFYAAVTGLHTSSVRAAVMSAVLLGGFVFERKAFALNSLAAAATLILCWDTNELFAIGFQLSFAVVTAIVLLADPIFQFVRRLFQADPFLPRSLFSARRRFLDSVVFWFARALAVSAAAWIGSLPLMLWYYNLVTLISLVANLVVVPIAFLVLAGGLLSMVAAPLSTSLSVVFNNTNWMFSKLILGAVHFFALLPGGHFYVEHPHWPTRARAEITVLDAKSGGVVHVHTARGDWLFDAGSARDYERVLRQYLRARGVNRLAGLTLSHGDAGHLGGAGDVLRDFNPRQVIDTFPPDRSPIHRKLIDELARAGKSRRLCATGDELELSREVKARVLFPSRDFQGDTADDQTLVVQLTVAQKWKILFMSDSGSETERMLLEGDRDLRSDIIIKGQHHSGNSGTDTFLDAVQPQAIIATSVAFPESERIKDDWAEGVRARGTKLFRQDETGAMKIEIFRDHWEAKSYLTSETFRSTSR